MPSTVIRPRPAVSSEALEHFQNLLRFETDCWDVHYAMTHDLQDFVLLDVRGEETAGKGFIQGAVILPHAKINEQTLQDYPDDTIFVVYCAGPHCNATEKAAIRLARLGRPVKKMIGGVTGWLDEGFELSTNA
ncbi:rhodanese-like domain-containing protein [Bowmanella dokdonensis]|uniref:Rhodanese-like domain-containing protein n=1 Tax=Bowmanella dokdonensis TaxID=751969 RepID=A0A939ITS9_9ALTE|nr:rhodanese-like domain-containing protein [Bowmanella dokdonensis]MBN7827761.1 rhodanese-like domain-containing protein [Bowmanella dokdonensis]